MTWAVAFHPDLTLAVEAVGPFRSQARAEAVCAHLSATIDSHEPDDHHPSRLPQVVQLISEAEAVERYQSGDPEWPCETCGSGEHNTSQHGSGFSAEQWEWSQSGDPEVGR